MHMVTRNVNMAFKDLVRSIWLGSRTDGPFQGQINVRKESSRNGPVLVIDEPVLITYTHPQERVLFNKERDANPFFHLYEALWMLAGRNDVASVGYYAKQMYEYSDDGKTLNGAYGYRWRNFVNSHDRMQPNIDQLAILIAHLKSNPTSRRAVLQMWNIQNDLLKIGGYGNRIRCKKCHGTGGVPILEGFEDEDKTASCPVCNGTSWIDEPASKDTCCNLSVMFSLRDKIETVPNSRTYSPYTDPNLPACTCADWGMMGCLPSCQRQQYIDKKMQGESEVVTGKFLDMTVTNRSNDMIWGLLGANVVHFSFLLEYMAAHLGVDIGKYHHFSNNVHVYVETNSGFRPKEWLCEYEAADNSSWMYYNPWDRPKTMIMDLVKDPIQFDRELPRIVEAFSGSETEAFPSAMGWEEPFFENVAKPMFSTFKCYKIKDYRSAKEWAAKIKADDWRIACTQWLERRINK
jgi:hypothetical protein